MPTLTRIVNYGERKNKADGRRENMEIYQALTGHRRIPRHRQYWTLCQRQSKAKTSEIVQLTEAGWMTAEQFHGVDLLACLVEANRKDHPDAHWYHGHWSTVIGRAAAAGQFKPAVVYLDTELHSDNRQAVSLLQATLPLCPRGCLVCINTICRFRHIELDPDVLPREVERTCGWMLAGWSQGIPYGYESSQTKMITHTYMRDA